MHSHLSRELDRIPFLPDDIVADMLPRMHLVSGGASMDTDTDAPEIFTECLLQVQLARFWRSVRSDRESEYDPTISESRYERFQDEYLSHLPPAFALNKSDTRWDEIQPKLAMQRQLLFIAIFSAVCGNFRPLLLLTPDSYARLAPYKQVLLQSQRRVLAVAALRQLQAISSLQSSFSGCSARFSIIVFNTFEASVLLLILCTHAGFPLDEEDSGTLILGQKAGRLTKTRLVQAAEKGLDRLEKFADFSGMALAGARVLAPLFGQATKHVASSISPTLDSSPSSWQSPYLDSLNTNAAATGDSTSPYYAHEDLTNESLAMVLPDDAVSSLPLPSLDFVASWGYA